MGGLAGGGMLGGGMVFLQQKLLCVLAVMRFGWWWFWLGEGLG